jgi:hypothetical protein
VLIKMGSKTTLLAADVQRVLNGLDPGRPVDLQIVREGRIRVSVTLGETPGRAGPTVIWV